MILRSGEAIQADFVVLAVPFDRVAGPDSRGRRADHARASSDWTLCKPRRSPAFISGSIALSARSITSSLPGGSIQWVFNHTAIQGRKAPEPKATHDEEPVSSAGGQYLQIVISALV